MRIAVFGLGAQAGAHIATLKRLESVEIVTVLVRDAAASAARAAGLGVRITTDLDAILRDPSIGAVVIATPTVTHAALACAALAAGKHVFCETPIAPTLSDADRMIAAAARAGRALQIGLIHRFEKPLPHLFALARSGTYGRIVGIETERLSAFAADGMAKDHHGDAIEELLAFDIHNLTWGFGRPRRIMADCHRSARGFVEVNALLVFDDFTARCLASNRMPRGHAFVERLRVRCDHAVLVSEATFAPGRNAMSLRFENGPSIPLPQTNPVRDQMAHFMAAISGAHCVADGMIAREVLELTLATVRACELGRPITL